MAAKDRPNPVGTLAKLIIVLVVCGVLAAGFVLPYVGGLGLAARSYASKFLNTQCNVVETAPPVPTEIFASDKTTLIATIFRQDRQPIPLSDVPKSLQDALIATEDRRFYSHHGVDMRGLIRSAISTGNGDTQGGSTLTMQYVKQIQYYQAGTNKKKQNAAIEVNLNRKIEDAQCAIQIEKRESKHTILDNYLNIAFFGENSYSLQTAAETYFDKQAKQLTLPESAMLVGLLRAPTAYDPFQYPQQAKQRRNQVLQNLVDVGDLSQKQADKYAKTPVALATQRPPLLHEGCANTQSVIINVGFFCDYVTNWLLHNANISQSELETGGLHIVTTLDARLQNSMQRNIDKQIPARSPTTAIMPVIDPRTGNILAMATSKRYGNHHGNSAYTTLPIFTSYTAQGASTYKLFPLLTALSAGVPTGWKLETPPDNQPYHAACLTPGSTTNGDAQETYKKNETLASATAKSSNTFFVGLADQLLGCDLQPIVNMAEKLGMNGLLQPSSDGKLNIAQSIINFQRAQQLVLGDVPTSPLEIAGAYAAVANGGRYNTPAPVVSITDAKDNPLPTKRSPAVQVVSPQVAETAIQVLTGDTNPVYPGTSAVPFESWYAANPSIVAGKTGTSVAVSPSGKDTDLNASLWFVGVTPNLVASTVLVNLDKPNSVITGLPAFKNPGKNAYGAYAAKVWLNVLQPSLVKKQWVWPDPSTFGGLVVPDVKGYTLAAARAKLAAAGFRMVQLDAADDLECSSDKAAGTIAFFAPNLAQKGSAITVCPSSGALQLIYKKPPPPPPTPKSHSKSPGSGSPDSPGSPGSPGSPSSPSNPSSPSGGSSSTSPGRHHGPPGHHGHGPGGG